MKKKIVFTDETENSIEVSIDHDQPAVYLETTSGENNQETYIVFTQAEDLDDFIGELTMLKDMMLAHQNG